MPVIEKFAIQDVESQRKALLTMTDSDYDNHSFSPFQRLYQWIVQWLNEETPPSDVPLCDFQKLRHELKRGDVILVEGRSRVSRVIKSLTISPWSHAALYIGRIQDIENEHVREQILNFYPAAPDEQLMIESLLGFGTIVQPITFYARDHLRICRPRGLNKEDGQQLIHYASSRLGLDYDIRQILDLMRFLMPWALIPRRWRSSLFHHHMGDQTHTVCSTMIAESFGYIKFPILPLVKKHNKGTIQLFRQNPKLCTPRDFDYSPYFEIIKYPFIDYTTQNSYRLLPWKGSTELTDEEKLLYTASSNFDIDPDLIRRQKPDTPPPSPTIDSSNSPPTDEADDTKDN